MGSQESVGSVSSTYPQSSISSSETHTAAEDDIIPETVPASMESNTKFGKWKDASASCPCSADHRMITGLRIVRTPLMSPLSDISLTSLRVTANIFTAGYAEQWLGTNNVPMEHQAMECDAVCIKCNTPSVTYTFEYLGGVGKQCRAGCYTNKYEGCGRQRTIKYTTLFLSEVFDTFVRLPGKWKSKHYDAVHNNCQLFATLLWRELFGSNEDDFGEWQNFAQYQCRCDEGNIYAQQMKLIRVQRCSAVNDETFSFLKLKSDDDHEDTKNGSHLVEIDAENTADCSNVLTALQIMCQCEQCGNKVPYTLENSARGKYFRCGAYGKQLRPFCGQCRMGCLSLGNVHALFKQCEFTSPQNEKWTCLLWNKLLKQNVQSTSK